MLGGAGHPRRAAPEAVPGAFRKDRRRVHAGREGRIHDHLRHGDAAREADRYVVFGDDSATDPRPVSVGHTRSPRSMRQSKTRIWTNPSQLVPDPARTPLSGSERLPLVILYTRATTWGTLKSSLR